MSRVKRGFKRRRRVKKVLDKAEGYTLGRKNMFRRAIEQVVRSHVYAYRDRKRKKRIFRGLWTTRISAAANENGLSYSVFAGGLKKAQVALNRKMLSEIAIFDPKAFQTIVNSVK